MKKFLLMSLALLGLNSCMNAQDSKFSDMNVEEFSKYVSGNDVQILDVRTPEEFEEGHIPNAKNINVFDSDFIDEAIRALDKSKPVAVYCRSGRRSADAAKKLSGVGFHVTNLEGGIIAWEKDNQPTTVK